MESNQFLRTLSWVIIVLLNVGISIWPNLVLIFVTISLMVALLVVNWFRGRFKHHHFIYYLFASLYLGMAFWGWQSAYQPADGHTKFLVLFTGVLFGGLLAATINQESTTHVTWSFSTGALFLAAVFFAVGLLGIARGDLLTNNRLAGMIIIFTPFIILGFLETSSILKWIFPAVGSIVTLALIISGSRGGGAALVIGLSAWWLLYQSQRNGTRSGVWGISVGLSSLLTIGAFGYWQAPSLLNTILAGIPGAESRIQLYANHRHLLSDYWLLGGGLDSFGGQYSQYVLSIPFLRFTYGHHFYIDTLLELGILGLTSILALYTISLVYLLTLDNNTGALERSQWHLKGATLASLIALILHGLIDDAIFGDSGSSFIFMAAGMAFALILPRHGIRKGGIISLVIVLVIGIAGIFSLSAIQSGRLSNSAAIEMAQVQLADWPTNEWSKGQHAAPLEMIAPDFERAIEINSLDTTSYYRLGLIHMESREFDEAKTQLSKAMELQPAHSGIKKNYGYALLWSGQIEEGLLVLEDLPEIQQEVDAYVWWWGQVGEDELSGIAQSAKDSGRLR